VSPARHTEAARLLGADTRDADPDDAGEVLATEIIRIMRAVGMPNGLSGVGYTEEDIAALTEGTYPQQRLLQNAPREMSKPTLADLFRQAMRYW
jgi:alcohol dehydrogenase class IV